ncbi:MAG TPA: helix-turn-helix transcriptional regulator [Moraxellaceae bacterium]
MASSEQLIATLKKVLKSRGRTYADLALGLGLSEASIKRLFSEKTFTLQRLEEVCRYLEMDIFELARMARGESDAVRQMTMAQEELLASDRKLLGLFYLLMNNRELPDILQEYDMTEPEAIRLLVKLDRARLIELLPGNRVRLRVSRQLRHRPDGPLRQKLGPDMVNEFLSVRFDEHGGHFRFEVGELSPASAAILQRKLDRLAAEFYELSELDTNLPPGERSIYGIAVGLRPWSAATEISGLRRRSTPGNQRSATGKQRSATDKKKG